MELYKEALFDAFVWTQAVENVVHDLVLCCADDERRRLQLEKEDYVGRDQLKGSLKLPLGELIKKLKPYVTEDFYNKLKELNRMRIEVVHYSDYVMRLRTVRLAKWEADDIRRLQEVKNYAESIYADLLRIFDDFFPIGEPTKAGRLE